MESLISERGLALSVGVSSSLPRIRTDQTQLRQILINMIGNAVKYTPSGSIQIRARLVGHDLPSVQPEPGEQEAGPPPDPSRRWVAVQVSDTGVGIATPDLERIFDEFEQVNAGARTDSVSRGTGLGLAISRRLARLLGGDLTVISEPGKGSTFTLWLPIEKRESADG
jgi:signal transduction histidine kinase